VFQTVVPEASAFKVALACRQPVSHYAPHSKAACAMGQLAQEIVQRIGLVHSQEMIA
jgi:chromosome partitioning protein